MTINKKTLVPMLTTAVLTLGLLAVINNVSALEDVADTVNGKSGWF
jgi:hypothetical protein